MWGAADSLKDHKLEFKFKEKGGEIKTFFF